jgi:hypothetical protein
VVPTRIRAAVAVSAAILRNEEDFIVYSFVGIDE